MNRFVLTLAVMLVTVFSVQASSIEAYPFKNLQEETRFHQLVAELRCPKCQNQNLADSDAPIAKDLKDKVYQKIQQGETDQEIVDYLVARYGDFIHYRPPFKASTLVLWLAPVALLLMGLITVVLRVKRRDTALSSEQQQRLARLLQDYQQGAKND